MGTPAGAGSPGPNLGELRAGAIGELAADFAGDLEHDSRLFGSVVRAIPDANFPATMHQDILDATGVALESVKLADVTVRPRGQCAGTPPFGKVVLLAYEYRCAVCGYDGQLLREAVGIDAAHVRWWAAAGPDEVANGIALCSLHHKLFDRGAIGLTADNGVAVSSHFLGRSPAADALVLSFVGKPLLAPQAGQPRPHATHVAWHSREVFRTPARQAAE